jgi:hypothetical protein
MLIVLTQIETASFDLLYLLCSIGRTFGLELHTLNILKTARTHLSLRERAASGCFVFFFKLFGSMCGLSNARLWSQRREILRLATCRSVALHF